LPAVRARCSPYASVGQLRLLSRNGNDMTASYPELGVLAERVNVPVSLDGEIIAIRGGRPGFRAAAVPYARPPAVRPPAV
jgi:ATP-dependent DNA ligase